MKNILLALILSLTALGCSTSKVCKCESCNCCSACHCQKCVCVCEECKCCDGCSGRK